MMIDDNDKEELMESYLNAQAAPVVAASELTDEQIHKVAAEHCEEWDGDIDGCTYTFSSEQLAQFVKVFAAAPAASVAVPAEPVESRAAHDLTDVVVGVIDSHGLLRDLTTKGLELLCQGMAEAIAAALAAAPATPAAQAQQPAGDGWIACADRLPEAGQQVIAYRPTAHQTQDEPVRLVRYLGDGRNPRRSWQGVLHCFDCICHVTHWMPLPPAPGLMEAE